MSLNLTEDIVVEIKHVSKALGNEICMFHAETGQSICSILPIHMPPEVFLDKHQSRLAKNDLLKCIFERYPTSTQDAAYDKDDKQLFPSGELVDSEFIDHFHVPVEQYDVSRHVLFVLDAAIKFPLPRGQTTQGV